jgi:NDP-hexose 2,3-enoyl reductase
MKSAQGRAAAALGRHEETIVEYERFCAKLGRDPAEVATAWVLARPHVTAVIAGPRTPEHLDTALRALETGLSAEEAARLDELFPPIGRGGPAPDAWLE